MYSVKKNVDSQYGKDTMPTIESIIRSNGTFIGVTYKTLKGKHKYYNGRTGVRGSTVENNKRYIRIWDVKLQQFRTLRKEGIKEIRANGLIMSYKI